jgi:hypothetical protein
VHVPLVGEYRTIVVADEIVHDTSVVNAARGDAGGVHEPTSGIDADMRLHAEAPRVACLGLGDLGIAPLRLICRM